MILCPNCSADMHFVPEKQKLVCDYCGCEESPEEYAGKAGLGAGDSEYFETTVFTCPQCGADLISTDETAATFCSYCGASVMLNSRLSREKSPDFMIPFKIGKDACKEAYKKTVKKAIFAPKALRADTEIEKFRGIYMPYWSYNMSVDSVVTSPGEESHREGDYIIKDHYDVSAHVDGTFEGIGFDASSSFSDNLSAGIAPFGMEEAVPFNPAYLSGFYADNGDVEDSTYKEDAASVVKDYVGECVSKTEEYKKYSIYGHTAAEHVDVIEGTSNKALFPVWFLSNRTGDRITYAVVNGQTGKAAADIPVDPKKYLIASLILMIPLFLLFNVLFTFTPAVALVISGILDLASIVIYYIETSALDKRERGETDKGLMSLEKLAVANETTIADAADFDGQSGQTAAAETEASEKSSFTAGKFLPQLAVFLIGVAVFFANPVKDIYYYLAIIAILAVTGISYVGIIKQHNLLTTRKLPQLNARGGDEDE